MEIEIGDDDDDPPISNDAYSNLIDLEKYLDEGDISRTSVRMSTTINDYSIGKKIAEGSFCEVFEGFHNKEEKSHTLRAIKVFKKKSLNSFKNLEQKIRNEIEILKKLKKSKHVVRFYDFFEDEKKIYVVLEFCSNGTLEQCILNREKNQRDSSEEGSIPYIDHEKVWDIFSQMIKGMEFIHQNNIIHRDIKPSNILITHKGTVKFSDFGNSLDLDDINNQLLSTKTTNDFALCTLAFQSPKILQWNTFQCPKKDSSSLVFSFADDVYSLGVCFYFLLFRQFPPLSDPFYNHHSSKKNDNDGERSPPSPPSNSPKETSVEEDHEEHKGEDDEGSGEETESFGESLRVLVDQLKEGIRFCVPDFDEFDEGGRKGKREKNEMKHLKELLLGMVEKEETKRWTLQEVKMNEWFRKYQQKYEKKKEERRRERRRRRKVKKKRKNKGCVIS